MIHPTAIISPKAHIDPTTSVGPYAIIEEGVVMGPHNEVGPHVYVAGKTTIGAYNIFHPGCVVGHAPQDLKYKGEITGLRIGDHNSIREFVTIHRATDPSEDTVIGSNNLFMAHCHVAHNCVLGNHVIIVNGALLGGHVVISDRAIVSGNCLVHQFVRIGMLAMMQGGSAISKDLPPFTVARGDNGIAGLNIIGLRRAGFTSEQRLEIKRLYHFLFRSGQKMSTALADARKQFPSEPSQLLINFVATTKRGICRDTGSMSAGEESAAE
jgi:UDP-N-acetylglucosamine acyltransferase